jgi:hypothetical protein
MRNLRRATVRSVRVSLPKNTKTPNNLFLHVCKHTEVFTHTVSSTLCRVSSFSQVPRNRNSHAVPNDEKPHSESLCTSSWEPNMWFSFSEIEPEISTPDHKPDRAVKKWSDFEFCLLNIVHTHRNCDRN